MPDSKSGGENWPPLATTMRRMSPTLVERAEVCALPPTPQRDLGASPTGGGHAFYESVSASSARSTSPRDATPPYILDDDLLGDRAVAIAALASLEAAAASHAAQIHDAVEEMLEEVAARVSSLRHMEARAASAVAYLTHSVAERTQLVEEHDALKLQVNGLRAENAVLQEALREAYRAKEEEDNPPPREQALRSMLRQLQLVCQDVSLQGGHAAAVAETWLTGLPSSTAEDVLYDGAPA
jgi:hypothetical protein